MRIKETPWEKENLGVDSSAVFYIEEDDTIAVIEEIVKNNKYIYQEAVVPVTKTDLVNSLLEGGFRFAEVSMLLSVKIPSVLPRIFKRHVNDFSFHVADETDIEQVFESIKYGTVFQTDKISLNPRFGPKVAAKRYTNWVSKEINEHRAFVYIIQCKNRNIGFSILRMNEKKICDGLLSGLLNLESYSGFGVYLGYYTILAAKSMGGERLLAHVSSNNMPVIRINQMLGYELESMSYVLTRYIDE